MPISCALFFCSVFPEVLLRKNTDAPGGVFILLDASVFVLPAFLVENQRKIKEFSRPGDAAAPTPQALLSGRDGKRGVTT